MVHVLRRLRSSRLEGRGMLIQLIFLVMAGLVPAIHEISEGKTWMAGTSPAMTK
jgi:hypothetical protein